MPFYCLGCSLEYLYLLVNQIIMMKHLILLALALTVISCENVKNKEQSQTPDHDIQKELEKEFGKYMENVKPIDSAYDKAYNKTLEHWKVPYVEIFVPTQFGKAHVIVSGPKNARPLVLLHGMNSSSTVWYPNIQAFSKTFRVYAIDHLDSGKSYLDTEVEDLEQVNDWYAEIFDELKLEKIYLLGGSKGGWLSVFIALHQASRIDKMVLLSPAQTFIWIRPGSDLLANITFAIKPDRDRLRSVLETLSADVDQIPQYFIDQYFLAAQKSPIGKFTSQMRPFSKDELNSLRMPVLVLIGDQDMINNEKSIEEAKALLPNAQTDIIENAGHMLSIDQPEIVNQKILGFLSR